MPNSDLLPSLLFKINQNQLALEAAVMELTLWVEQRGSGERRAIGFVHIWIAESSRLFFRIGRLSNPLSTSITLGCR